MPVIRFLIILVAVLITALILSNISLKRTSGDFDVYYDSARHYLNKEPVYVPHGGINEFKYSPLFALCYAPLTLMPKISALYLWSIFKLVCFFGIFLVLYKLKQISFLNFKDLLILIFLFAVIGRYIIADFKLGQANVLLCFLMSMTMYFEINKKYLPAAALLALSLMIKFIPLLFVLYYLLRRRFKLLAYTALMAAVFLIVPSFYTGLSLNLKYLHEWFLLLKSTPPVILYSVKNYSLLSYFSWMLIARHEIVNAFDYIFIKKGLTSAVYLAWVISSFVFFVSFFYDTFFVKDKDTRVVYLDYSCLFVCGLLFNPLAYLNALTFLIIPYFFVLRYLFYGLMNRRAMITAGGFVFLSFLLTILDNRLFFKDTRQFYFMIELKPLMWAIILVYASLWTAKFSIRSKSPSSDM